MQINIFFTENEVVVDKLMEGFVAAHYREVYVAEKPRIFILEESDAISLKVNDLFISKFALPDSCLLVMKERSLKELKEVPAYYGFERSNISRIVGCDIKYSKKWATIPVLVSTLAEKINADFSRNECNWERELIKRWDRKNCASLLNRPLKRIQRMAFILKEFDNEVVYPLQERIRDAKLERRSEKKTSPRWRTLSETIRDVKARLDRSMEQRRALILESSFAIEQRYTRRRVRAVVDTIMRVNTQERCFLPISRELFNHLLPILTKMPELAIFAQRKEKELLQFSSIPQAVRDHYEIVAISGELKECDTFLLAEFHHQASCEAVNQMFVSSFATKGSYLLVEGRKAFEEETLALRNHNIRQMIKSTILPEEVLGWDLENFFRNVIAPRAVCEIAEQLHEEQVERIQNQYIFDDYSPFLKEWDFNWEHEMILRFEPYLDIYDKGDRVELIRQIVLKANQIKQFTINKINPLILNIFCNAHLDNQALENKKTFKKLFRRLDKRVDLMNQRPCHTLFFPARTHAMVEAIEGIRSQLEGSRKCFLVAGAAHLEEGIGRDRMSPLEIARESLKPLYDYIRSHPGIAILKPKVLRREFVKRDYIWTYSLGEEPIVPWVG